MTAREQLRVRVNDELVLDAGTCLVDHVFPRVPVRPVLSLPPRLRYQLAWNHDLCRAVVGVSVRAILRFLRHRAREAGVVDGRGGAAVLIQRFGGALNLNIQFHPLVLDGVFAMDKKGLRFHPHPELDAADVDEVLATVEAHVSCLLARCGLGDVDDGGSTLDDWADEAPVLAGLAAASVQGRVALGPRAGERVRRCGIRPIYTVTPQTAASTNTIRDEITIHGVASAAKVEFDVFELRWKRSHDPIEVSEGSILV